MKQLHKNNLSKFPYVIYTLAIVILSLFLRFLYLDRIPTGLSHDEMNFIINSYSFYHEGKGIIYTPSPLTVTRDYPKSEMQSIFFAPFIGNLSLTLLNSRLPYALLGVLTVLLLILITTKLFNYKNGLVVGFLTAINPWNIFFSRTVYDAPFTTFFLLLSFYLGLTAKGWMLLSMIVTLFIAFHSYTGMTLVFLPYVITTLTFLYFYRSKKYLVQYAIIFSAALIFVIRFIYIQPIIGDNSRMGELITPYHSRIVNEVDMQRKLMISVPGNVFFVNKLSVFLMHLGGRFAGAFSPVLLFITGDSKYLFSTYQHGLFYIIDFIWIMLGFYAVFSKSRKIAVLLFSFLIISVIPSLLSSLDSSYASRSYLMQPVLLIYAGIGLKYLNEKIKSFRKIFYVSLFFIYVLLVFNFMFIYLFRNPVYNSESFSFSLRVLSRYLSFESSNSRSIIVLTDRPREHYLQYIFYNRILSKINLKEINNSYNRDSSYGNVRFLKCPPTDAKLADVTLIVENNILCPDINESLEEITGDTSPLIIPQLRDAGSVYKIYNGVTCSGYNLNRYPGRIKFNEILMESLPDDNFCMVFINRF